jgi:AcrR family transcriptional regulator
MDNVHLESAPVKVYSDSMSYPSKTDRQTILETAMNLVSKAGVESLAIRSVAAELNLAPNALYRYFPNLAGLRGALAEESRRRLLEELKSAAREKPAQESIRGIAMAYVQFAREQPHIFSLTLLPPSSDGEAAATHLQSWHFVVAQVAQIYGTQRSEKAAVALWALLHGMTVLEAAGVLGEEKPADGFGFGLDMWIHAASLNLDQAR